MKSKNISFLLFTFYFLLSSSLNSEDAIDENAMFSDEVTVVAQDSLKSAATPEAEKNTYSLSGNVYSINSYAIKKDYLSGSGGFDGNIFSAQLKLDLFLDIRLKTDAKAFINLELSKNSQDVSIDTSSINPAQLALFTPYTLKEFFIDSNIKSAVYYRIGKQVIQWGRTFFWNPTDLVNREKKSFLDLYRAREGTYGLRLHVPVGGKSNVYCFLDATNTNNVDGFAVSAKYEFLIKNTELAFSAWNRKNGRPILGFDFSSRLLGLDIYGEIAASDGENRYKLDETTLVKSKPEGWSAKYSLGLSRSFDWELKDRIRTTFEIYANPGGYSADMFRDTIKRNALINQNLYLPNDHGRLYAAMFASVSRFINSDWTLNFNTISNLTDQSYISSLGVSYTPFYNFTLAFNIVGFYGEPESEYTFSKNALSPELRFTLAF